MCGIAGILDLSRQASNDELRARAEAMASTLHHRGPDGAGSFVDAGAGIALGHTRLAIIDLSEAGHQPMSSRDGRFTITYNGEVYNHRDLRTELESAGAVFRGHSDTEVLLEAIARWGVRRAVEKANGMFAFAVWDGSERTLTLARDRLGEKPLYYGRLGGRVVFASELRALRAEAADDLEVDAASLVLYLRDNAVPAPHSIYRGVRKVPPGHLVTIRPDRQDPVGRPEPYWRVHDAAAASGPRCTDMSAAEDQLHSLLSDAVAMRMVADVPVGAFLSGGIDSSLVVALMRAHTTGNVRTFTIGFRQPEFDEARFARPVAGYLGVDHTEVYLTADEAIAQVPHMASVYDEPFGDSSQLPTTLVSQLARRHVTVALTGDGGDELFAGYARYLVFERLWGAIGRIPGRLRRLAGEAILRVPAGTWNRALGGAVPLLPAVLRQSRPGDKLHRMAVALPHRDVIDAYRAHMAQWPDPAAALAGAAAQPSTGGLSGAGPVPGGDVLDSMRYLDQTGYLPDDILTKVDRASMSVSLEGRIPLLDHRVVELSWRLHRSLLIEGGSGKLIVRRLLARYLPRELFERPKMGFAVPVADWLRGPLRDWAESLLDPASLRAQGLLEPAAVRGVWDEHLQRSGDWIGTQQIWSVLMFQAWLESSTKRAA